jgi:hypothetical protein
MSYIVSVGKIKEKPKLLLDVSYKTEGKEYIISTLILYRY